MIDKNNKFSKMQKNQYDHEANIWSIENRDPVVGSFDLHNSWQDYNIYLFKDINTIGKISLDFGCGPGRNIVKFSDQFKQIDGIDISEKNLENAKIWCNLNNKPSYNFYVNDGVTMNNVPSDYYDIVFSTICFQHICIYDIRFSLLKEIFRTLKSGGHICFQMGYGSVHPESVDYYDNNYHAKGTNGQCDTRVEDANQIKQDLEKIGFSNFSYDIRPVGPGDRHSNWIFFRATK